MRVGEVLTEWIFKPILRGELPDTYREFIIGGSLFAIGKSSGGIRPIIIGDADCRITTCGLMKQCKEKLKTYLLRSHDRVAQFGVGVEDGGVKAYHTIQSLLPSFPDSGPGPDATINKIICLVSLDGKNAFNSMNSAAIFDAILGQALKEYGGGHISYGDTFPAPSLLQDYIDMLEAHYLDTANLTFIAPDRERPSTSRV
eukprot:3846940-Rhodomonas_salina.2